jgi:hypothetical protein
MSNDTTCPFCGESFVIRSFPIGGVAGLEVSAGFDNSPNNKFNPDPKKEARWGDQSWEEMMIGYFEIGFNPKLDLPDMMGAGRRQLE